VEVVGSATGIESQAGDDGNGMSSLMPPMLPLLSQI